MPDINFSPTAIAEAEYQGCQVTHEFLNRRVQPRAKHACDSSPSMEAEIYHLLLVRAVAWLRTLRKLNEPSDYQAVLAASRTLFEIAIDVTLMRLDATNPPAKLRAWEDSALLKSAQKIVDFASGRGKTLVDHSQHAAFIARESVRIKRLRSQYWPGKKGKGAHPSNRWTGRNLADDAHQATRLWPAITFDEFYEARYDWTCWHTHGSGIAGLRYASTENFPAISALAYGSCADYALVVAEQVLRYFEFWDTEVSGEFKQHRRISLLTRYATMTKQRAEEST